MTDTTKQAPKDRIEQVSKPGRDGTLWLYEIDYCDAPGRSGCPVMRWRTWAYEIDHAVMKFRESEDSEGWTLLGIRRVPVTAGTSRARTHRL